MSREEKNDPAIEAEDRIYNELVNVGEEGIVWSSAALEIIRAAYAKRDRQVRETLKFARIHLMLWVDDNHPAIRKIEDSLALLSAAAERPGDGDNRRAELIAEVDRIRHAGTDPANAARKRLLEICDELLGRNA